MELAVEAKSENITKVSIQEMFSNTAMVSFKIDSETFNCVQQFMGYYKAMMFNDIGIAYEILRESNIDKQKVLIEKIIYNEDVWDCLRYDILSKGIRRKVLQNPELKNYLAEFKECEIDFYKFDESDKVNEMMNKVLTNLARRL